MTVLHLSACVSFRPSSAHFLSRVNQVFPGSFIHRDVPTHKAVMGQPCVCACMCVRACVGKKVLTVFSHILSRKCVCMCVFSCSWRFTFYLLAFIAGLAALIDVSSAMLILTPPLSKRVLMFTFSPIPDRVTGADHGFHGSPAFCLIFPLR